MTLPMNKTLFAAGFLVVMLSGVATVHASDSRDTNSAKVDGKSLANVPAATLKLLDALEIQRELKSLEDGAKKVGYMLMGFVGTRNASALDSKQKKELAQRLEVSKKGMAKCLDSSSIYKSFSAAFALKLSAEKSEQLTTAYSAPAGQQILQVSRDASTPEGAFAASAYFKEGFPKYSKAREEQVRMMVAASRYVDARTRLARNVMPAVLKIQHEKMTESQLQNKMLASQDEYVMEGLAAFAYGTRDLTQTEMTAVLKLYATPEHRAFIAAKNQALEPVTEALFQCLLSSLSSVTDAAR
jgi:hypothetical protein